MTASTFKLSIAKVWLPPILLAAVSLLGLPSEYLVFHVLAEFMSIFVAFMALIVALNSRTFTQNNYLTFVSVLIFWCAAIDVIHTMSYKGMHLLVEDNGNVGIQLWLVARFVQAVGFLIAPAFLIRPMRLWLVNVTIVGVIGIALWTIYEGYFPAALPEGTGLTPFKIWSEYVIVVILMLSLVHLYRNRADVSPDVLRYMSYATVAMMISELAFTQYASVDDRFNLFGHLAKIFAYWFIFIALVQKTLKEPFDQLARAASTYDAVADPTLIVSVSGQIIRANQAAAALLGKKPKELIGASSHALFHRADLAMADCPVCKQLKSAETSFVVALDLGEQNAPKPTEFRVSPLPFPGADRAFVQVIRDIGQQLQIESLQVMRSQSEDRFREVFEYSPTPMLIYSIHSGNIVRINKAFSEWLGYQLVDISNIDSWFELVYPDAQVREAIRQRWATDVAEAQRAVGVVVRSPELLLCSKDGRLRVALGSMTADQDEAIIAWEDLTEIRSAEKELQASEQHFRAMIEQSTAGMYVRRDGKFIYANPMFLRMLGYEPGEILGKEALGFTTTDPKTLDRIHQAWSELDSGAESVTYTVPIRKKDGSYLTAELHAKQINWDGMPAHIVLANDITERTRQQERIAAYTAQLERSMESTLAAIARMVEMRDPYTAGHERRVGLIARDIAIEMGWPEEKAEPLKMIGLVHDIGKISVPSEILTKPSRLTDLEMQMVRTHAQAGYEILKDVDFPLPVAEIIHQHHERLDGSGYPQGLKGDAILPEARVLAVADLVESMATHRPYRPALGLNAALDELRKSRGQLYDPDAVDALIRLVTEKDYRLPA